MKLDRQSKQFFFMPMLVLFTIIFMFGLWTIDIGCSALVAGGSTYSIFGIRDPNVTYHLGISLAMSSFIAVSIISAYLVATMKETEN